MRGLAASCKRVMWMSVEEENEMEVNTTLVHAAHCCGVHGCKYSDEECGVAAGTLEQEHPCEFCPAPVVEQIVSWLEGRIKELDAQSLDHNIAGYIRLSARDRADHYRDVVRGLEEGAWKK